MSRVIKNNDGVAVVEGTPAASLVKDVDKFFASKPPERMAGESIGRPKKIDNIKPVEDKARYTGGSKDFNERTGRVEPDFRDTQPRKIDPTIERQPRDIKIPERRVRPGLLQSPGLLRSEPVPDEMVKRNEARDKAESRRKRFFERRRSRKEAERSEVEQEATQGKFITTLGR